MVGEILVGEKKVGEILVGEMQIGEKTWSVKLKVGEILGHPIFRFSRIFQFLAIFSIFREFFNF